MATSTDSVGNAAHVVFEEATSVSVAAASV